MLLITHTELTLNQALSSWIMEMHLQRSMRLPGSFAPETVTGFSKLMCNACNLPHPAAKQFILDGNVKATDLSKLAFNILDRLIYTLFDGKKYQLSDIQGIQTIRFCGMDDPQLVRLLPLPSHQLVCTVDSTTNQMIFDNPALNLQYVSSFGLSVDDENITRDSNERKKKPPSVPVTMLIFQKVHHLFEENVQSGTLSDALIKLMKR